MHFHTIPQTNRSDTSVQIPSASIVVPAYNEESIITENLNILYDYMESFELDISWEIIIVNDGSTDSTGQMAEDFAQSHKNVHVCHHRANFGLGQALRTAFNKCRGDYVVTIDLDLSYSPDHIGLLLTEILNTQVQIVIASPYMKGGKLTNIPYLRKILSKLANRLLSVVASGKIRTLTGLVRAYDRKFLKALNLKAMDMEVNPEIIYKAQLLRARIIEIPAHLDWSYFKSAGKSRRSGFRMLRSIIASLMSAFIFRPFMFFIAMGIFLFSISLYIIVWIFIHVFSIYSTIQSSGGYFDDRFTIAVAEVFRDRPHAFLIGGFILVIAVQILSLGILSLQKKRYFEELFHLSTTRFDDNFRNGHK
ncbi:MAG: glycosyltransferase family 2 protein [Candidatus Aminicenantes bacterium]|nr:glycosyltransferase family 2 protein [Candidatus Aminicenantes bacterium]